jgi:hypothetical protein
MYTINTDAHTFFFTHSYRLQVYQRPKGDMRSTYDKYNELG